MDPTPARQVSASVDELLAGVSAREPMKTAESLSTATFERVVIDGDRYIVKYLHVDDDWIMRATGDLVCRPAVMWTTGMFDALPPCLDHAMAGVATGLGRNGWGSALLLHDVGAHLVPDTDEVITRDDHDRFMANMAAFHAHFWGFTDTIGLCDASTRYILFNEHLAPIEAALGSGAHVPTLVAGGLERMAEISPAARELVRALFADQTPLIAALEATPQTFIHGDWKFGNLGNHPDGRTIVLDWAFPGEGAPTSDLAWYLGVNCQRLPVGKDDAIDEYRTALDACGIDTSAWWDRQLGLALIGNFLQQGWSKTFDGRDAEFTWWEERVLDATRYLA